MTPPDLPPGGTGPPGGAGFAGGAGSAGGAGFAGGAGAAGGLHHVELWMPDLLRADESWGWLLRELGWQPGHVWDDGRTWSHGTTYLVLERSPAMTADRHERLRPGLNHLAFRVGPSTRVDDLVVAAPAHGWSLLFADRHPYAGGTDCYAAYLEDRDGYEVELVATR